MRRKGSASRQIRIRGARCHNLRDVDVDIPIGLFSCVTGVSGSGKSTLVNDTLYAHAAATLSDTASAVLAPVIAVEGLQHFDRVIDIDQNPIGRTPRSNPATYTGLFGAVRELYAQVPEARARGYGAGRFSFNVRGGRCEACQGDGVRRVEMHFLPDIYVPCDVCRGQRYNRETLEIRYRGRNIHETLDTTVEAALAHFENVPAIAVKLRMLREVGLGYLRLGQSATTLSGGEAQRVKLARELAKRDTGRTLYILDEPTTGLHFHDIAQLLEVLQRLAAAGNTVIVIEHNLDVIRAADWVIDLGPGGGEHGGRVVATGTPEDIARDPASVTGRYLSAAAIDS
jgi:excinuclease ABC subunit A